MVKDEELERICFNCNNFFPACMDEATEFGICLNDQEFEPFINELLENSNYTCCQDLVERKKFSGENEACPDFSEVEVEESIEIDDDSEFGRELISSIKSGQFNQEKLNELLIKEQIRNIDWKTVPVEKYAKQLKNPKPEERNAAISSLAALIAYGNKAAFQELFNFFRQLPPPKTIEEVHFKKDLLRHLELANPRTALTQFLLSELYNTPSNNTTRQWISAIFRFLEHSPFEEVREPLEKMLSDKQFSYRLKQKIKDILYRGKTII